MLVVLVLLVPTVLIVAFLLLMTWLLPPDTPESARQIRLIVAGAIGIALLTLGLFGVKAALDIPSWAFDAMLAESLGLIMLGGAWLKARRIAAMSWLPEPPKVLALLSIVWIGVALVSVLVYRFGVVRDTQLGVNLHFVALILTSWLLRRSRSRDTSRP